jgi:hydroxymethylpyrimidine pyrophosphatase-like HAD family hydrolase
VPGIVETMHDLAAAGVKLVPCTGRPLHGALRAATTLVVPPAACVAYHGALVVDLDSGERLRQLTLPDELAAGLAVAGLAAGLEVSLYVGDERQDLAAGWAPPAASGAAPGPLAVPGVTRLVLAGEPARVTPALPLLDGARRAGQRIEDVRPGVVVVLPGGADKGEGLRLVASHFGVPPGRVVACGDDLNDITLLLAAGRSVAVGDALPALRAVADATVAQDGLATTLRHAFARLG